MRGITFDKFKRAAEALGFEVLGDKFTSPKGSLAVKCKKGHVTQKSWDCLRAKAGCSVCAGNARKSYKEVKREFEMRGFELLEKAYKNSKTKMKLKCKKGHITYSTRDAVVNQGNGCAKCNTKNAKKDYGTVKGTFEKEGYELVSAIYKNAHEKLNVICPNGHKIKISYDKFKNQGQRCRYCYRERNRGENHPNWNSNLTDEERLANRDTLENKRWRKAVFERDNYTCRKCFKKGILLNAHHIENYATAKEKRFDVDNGLTLCEACHKEFHKIYGTTNNDEWQVKEFLGREEEWNLLSVN